MLNSTARANPVAICHGFSFEKLQEAIKNFIAALINVRSAHSLSLAPKSILHEYALLSSSDELYILASQLDRTMPDHAAELRKLAGRD